MTAVKPKILALTGGVGGAKLALGLADILPAAELEIAVNTGDDFSHLGLHISPDIDTLLYTLSGRSNRELGWGLAGESWQAMDALAEQTERVLARLQRAGIQGDCGPLLNEPIAPEEWLARPGAPKARLDEEKPQGETVPYDELIQAWREGRAS